MAQRCKRLHAKFNRLVALNVLIDERDDAAPGARKTKKILNDNWSKRHARNSGDLFKAKAAKPGACYVTAGVA